MLQFEWRSISKHGFRLLLQEQGEEVGEALIWEKDNGGIRVNWLMVMKPYQGKGYARLLMEEIKQEMKYRFPSAKVIIFEDVTSREMLKLIESVFGEAERYLDFLSDELKVLALELESELPLKSPAKYNPDGSSRISKKEIRKSYKISLI